MTRYQFYDLNLLIGPLGSPMSDRVSFGNRLVRHANFLLFSPFCLVFGLVPAIECFQNIVWVTFGTESDERHPLNLLKPNLNHFG